MDILDGCLFFTLCLNISVSEFLLSGSISCLMLSGGLHLEEVITTSGFSPLPWPMPLVPVGEVLREEGPASVRCSAPELVWVPPVVTGPNMNMGLLRSAVGEVGVDSAGVVLYSEELLELARMWDMELNLLMLDLTMRRASMVEEKGSPSASSAILVIWLSMVVSGSILLTSDWRRR